MAEIVVALDHDRGDDALALVDRLDGLRWVKVGPTLFVREGPELVRALKRRELAVFLDLKWHDIPHQVAGSVRAAGDLGADLATVHALGGPRMLAAAQRAAHGSMRLVAVSVLTSHDDAALRTVLGRPADAGTEVTRLARLALEAGLAGLVASVAETPALRRQLPDGSWIVTPGIRPPGTGVADQRRVATPAEAVTAGATHLVVGRPITGAEDPNAVYQQLCHDTH